MEREKHAAMFVSSGDARRSSVRFPSFATSRVPGLRSISSRPRTRAPRGLSRLFHLDHCRSEFVARLRPVQLAHLGSASEELGSVGFTAHGSVRSVSPRTHHSRDTDGSRGGARIPNGKSRIACKMALEGISIAPLTNLSLSLCQ